MTFLNSIVISEKIQNGFLSKVKSQFQSMRPSVAPSDNKTVSKESLHSTQKPIPNDSPNHAISLSNELKKSYILLSDTNGATLGRIQAAIKNRLNCIFVTKRAYLKNHAIFSLNKS